MLPVKRKIQPSKLPVTVLLNYTTHWLMGTCKEGSTETPAGCSLFYSCLHSCTLILDPHCFRSALCHCLEVLGAPHPSLLNASCHHGMCPQGQGDRTGLRSQPTNIMGEGRRAGAACALFSSPALSPIKGIGMGTGTGTASM